MEIIYQPYIPFVIGGGALFMYGLVSVLRIGRRPKDLPPGPPTIPVLGNLHLVSIYVEFLLLLLTPTDAERPTSPPISEVGR